MVGRSQSRTPSTAFCLLYKYFVMGLTKKQMTGLLNHDNAFVRGIGFLYLRYVAPAAQLGEWFEPFLEDSQEFTPFSDKKKM